VLQKNHEAAKSFIEKNSSFFKDHIHKTATNIFEEGSMESYFSPFRLWQNPNDSNKTTIIVGNTPSLKNFRVKEKWKDLRFDVIAKFDPSGKFTGLDVPPGFNFSTGIKWIREIFSPSEIGKGIKILTKTSDEYYTGASTVIDKKNTSLEGAFAQGIDLGLKDAKTMHGIAA
jgi:hypothetical protein